MNQNLFEQYLESMNFLNEACIQYQDAISFGSGRPCEQYFNVNSVIQGVEGYVERNPKLKNMDYIGQYNMTKGIINDDIAKLMEKDHGIKVSGEDIVMTDGAQEGMAIIINTLFDKGDVLLVSDPSYVGFIGYAKILGIEICPVERKGESIDFDQLKDKIKELHGKNKTIRALYEVADFHNPTGSYMSEEDRLKLISIANENDFYIIEDNPYGYFCYDGEQHRTMKALDTFGKVIYLESFSKTVFPAIRVGCLVLGQKVMRDGKEISLADECKKVKSFITVNTSNLLQAMLGEILYKEQYSLSEYCQPKIEYCKKNRDYLCNAIETNILNGEKWDKPKGGFFGVLDVPFPITVEKVLTGAKDFGVIVCPMSMFSLHQDKPCYQIRLAFSNMSKENIEEGIVRLKKMIEYFC